MGQLWFFKVCFLYFWIQAERSTFTWSYYFQGRGKRGKTLAESLESPELLSTGQLNFYSDFSGQSQSHGPPGQCQWGEKNTLTERLCKSDGNKQSKNPLTGWECGSLKTKIKPTIASKEKEHSSFPLSFFVSLSLNRILFTNRSNIIAIRPSNYIIIIY